MEGETININRLTVLLSYYNKLVRRFEVPAPVVDLEYDNVYSLQFEGDRGTFMLFERDNQLQFFSDGQTRKFEGLICDYDYKQISDLIKEIL